MLTVGSLPSLSRIEAWDTEDLRAADAHWTNTANLWDDAFTDVWQQMSAPGGTRWEGETAEAAQYQAFSDRLTVIGLADQLRDAAAIAGPGAEQLDAAKQRALEAVAEARAAGFDVGEDLSVSDRYTGWSPEELAVRQDQADVFAADIRHRAGALAGLDREIAGNIAAATPRIGTVPFDEVWNRTDTQMLGFGPNGQAPLAPPGKAEPEGNRRENQIDAFKQVFGREPVSAADWETAAALDPHSYDPKNGGVPPNIVVGQIKPVPGQGVVRTNLFIPGRSASAIVSSNAGDSRGFNPNAGPEDSRVTIYTDYENGIVIARQNPSINLDTGEVKVGHPDVKVSQNPAGSVLIEYRAVDPFSPGGEGLAKAGPWNVNGQLVIKPTAGGPIAGGIVSDFPAIEMYDDNGGLPRELGKVMPRNTSIWGPLVGLPWSQNIGTPLMTEFPDTVYLPPPGLPAVPPVDPTVPHSNVPPVLKPPAPIVIPYPSVELGPVNSPVHVPVGN